jgi:RNA-directed DNA polymerase
MYNFFTVDRVKYLSHELSDVGHWFLALRSSQDVADHLGITLEKFQQASRFPKYASFFLGKKQGGTRLIEHPAQPLKYYQERLAFSLQAAYYKYRSHSAYGFLINPTDDPQPRNIYTHAARHLGRKWVLNFDLKDFFHHIRHTEIRRVLTQAPFQFNESTATDLTRMFTWKGRLPMGAPSSPILSNWACLTLDRKMESIAEARNWFYTRFADDFTLSSERKFKDTEIEEARGWMKEFGFVFNENKVFLTHRDDLPEVTGLVLKDSPDVSKTFLKAVKKDIQLLELLTDKRARTLNLVSTEVLSKLAASVGGQLAFLKYIRGESDKNYQKWRKQLEVICKGLKPL